jgi:hypothetical protein
MQGRMPPNDVVDRVLSHPPPNVQLIPHDFPLGHLEKVADIAANRRREYAMEALRGLLIRHSGSEFLTEADCAKLTANAWNIARGMVTEEQTASQLDSLGKPPAQVSGQ